MKWYPQFFNYIYYLKFISHHEYQITAILNTQEATCDRKGYYKTTEKSCNQIYNKKARKLYKELSCFFIYGILF